MAVKLALHVSNVSVYGNHRKGIGFVKGTVTYLSGLLFLPAAQLSVSSAEGQLSVLCVLFLQFLRPFPDSFSVIWFLNEHCFLSCTPVCAHVLVHVHVCGSQETVSGIAPQGLSTLFETGCLLV